MPIIRTYQEEVVVVQVDLYDAQSGQAIWSSSAETSNRGSESQRTDAIREAVEKAMSAYPPS
ncbi:hypothetical protein D3C78_1848580 [compost metagenome]